MSKIVAHRGYHKHRADITENTVRAFKEAKKYGAYGIELDVYRTTDGRWVVHHDPLFDKKLITKLSSSDILKIAENNNFEINFLDEVINELPEFPINIEAKENSAIIGKKLAGYLIDNELVDHCHISSFSSNTLIGAREVSKNIRLSILSFYFRGSKWEELDDKIKLYSINPYYKFIRKNLVERARKRELEIHTWVANTKKAVKKSIKKQYDIIMTDRLELAMKVYNDTLNNNTL